MQTSRRQARRSPATDQQKAGHAEGWRHRATVLTSRRPATRAQVLHQPGKCRRQPSQVLTSRRQAHRAKVLTSRRLARRAQQQPGDVPKPGDAQQKASRPAEGWRRRATWCATSRRQGHRAGVRRSPVVRPADGRHAEPGDDQQKARARRAKVMTSRRLGTPKAGTPEAWRCCTNSNGW